ncbi:MAG: glycosyltransferase family 2 protein [Lentisphaeria bacterium]|nr:glycosyltransferase family 2 protein [Lentisphaeria bacterium]
MLNYNSSGDCIKSIANLQNQRNVDCEIIVVDNASHTDDLLELRKICADAGVTLLENHVNRGYSAGNNVGLRYAAAHGAELAMIVNPDMRFPDYDYVAALSRVFEKDDKIVVAATDILHIEGWHQNPLPPDRGGRSSFDWLWNLFRGNRRPDIQNYNESGACEKISGCCFMIRMDFLQSIGFFDEYPFLYCEEAILAAQVRRAHRNIYYLADRQAIHLHIAPTKGDPVSRMKQFLRSRLFFQWRYSDENIFSNVLTTVSFCIWTVAVVLSAKIKGYLSR